MVSRSAAAWSVLSALVLLSSTTRAETADANDVRALETQLEEEHAALSTADCSAACRALGSIRRAADKICALEPGPRCESARKKAADATERVRDACPDCMVEDAPAPAPERAATPADHELPAASPERGGCRSCATTGSDRSFAGTALLLVGVAAAMRLLARSRSERRAPRRRR